MIKPLAAVAVATTLLLLTTTGSLAQDTDPTPTPEPTPDPARQFDYWCGQWSIQNTRTRTDGSQVSGPATLSVRPIVNGAAILEEAWEGTGDMTDFFGASLRYYDPELERWVVILAWPGGAPGKVAFNFGRMEGVFTDTDSGPACHLYQPDVFLGPGTERKDEFRFRFVFHDQTPTSLRWSLESHRTEELQNVWQMDFTRTADSADTNTPLTINHPPQQCACTDEGVRDLDWIIGTWNHTDSDLVIRATSAIRGCTTFLEVADGPEQQHFLVLAYVPSANNWQVHSIDTDTRHAKWQGDWTPDTNTLSLTATENSHPELANLNLTFAHPDNQTLQLSLDNPADENPPAQLTFTKAQD